MSSRLDTETATRYLEQLQKLEDIIGLICDGICEEQLKDFGPKTLKYWCTVYGLQRQYDKFSIKKRSGKTRIIHAPKCSLKRVQKILNLLFSAVYQPRNNVHGFVPKFDAELEPRGIKTNAAKHIRKKWLLNIDLEDFFPSIHLGRIRGVLMQPPFSLNKLVAHTLAQLCTYPTSKYRTILPQGAPTSPVLSNFVCRGLDYDLAQLAREQRCHYTRYADDITFSTDRSIFPYQLAVKEKGTVELGKTLLNILDKHGFRVNEAKTSLRYKSSRHRVTGLIVNEKVNVPRQYIKNTNAMLHSWEKQGLETASQRFAEYDTRNRQKPSTEVCFNEVMRGRIEFIGSIRGKRDHIYHKLATKLAELDSGFQYTPLTLGKRPGEIRVFTEGKTDIKHLEAAREALGIKLTTPRVEFVDKGGESNLEQALNHAKGHSHKNLHLFIFDRDNAKFISKFTDNLHPYKNHGNNVFSLVIPVPKHRSDMEEICIEHYYQDETLKTSLNGRRLYTSDEFDLETGFHLIDDDISRPHPKKKPLIVEDSVFSRQSKQSVALTKNDFVDAILEGKPPFDNVDFTAFQEIFDAIQSILDLYD